MRLDDRPAIDQLADPEPVAYCWSCGKPISEHSPELELELGCVRNRLEPVRRVRAHRGGVAES